MFFFPTDTLVQQYVEMIKRNAILLEDVPHYLNLHDCVEKELERQGIEFRKLSKKSDLSGFFS